MNKKDCNDIAYILATQNVPGGICLSFFQLDPRIKTEYDLWMEEEEIKSRVEEVRNRILKERFGMNYTLRRDCNVLEWKKAMEDARKEVFGDNYDPSMFPS